MKHEYDQNVHVHAFRPTIAGIHENFLFIELALKELLALPKMIDD